ncbi:Hypothetical predicted protein [Mytilus galloprovincialis]|uniref:B box-type domain-containing protein n=1 Tax=Mytilus galloprovincialis TaxID=29158 RepID=A0A8B6CDD0_MYTGA|nr:Hypothetical predicted protein [Mytilus galloprovincialis]
MATERALNCSPCDYKHETTPAVKWCIDCTEALCSTCFDVHKGLKFSRNHNVIGIEDQDTLQGIILDLPEDQRCDLHDKALEYFCPLHDELVCIKCIQTKHSQCTGWLPISEAADGVKSSVTKETISQDLEDVITNFEGLINNHKKEQIANQNACKILKGKGSKVVQSIIEKVKDLETKFVNTVEEQEKDISGKIGSRIIEVQDKLKKIKDLRDKLNGIEGYASDTQIFLSIRKISEALSDYTEEVKSLTEEPITIFKELQLAAPFQTFLSEVKLLGHVQKDKKLIAFQPTKLQKVQSPVSVSRSKPIDNIEIQNIVKIDVSKSQNSSKLWSAVVLQNGQLIFKWNDSNYIVMYTSDGKFVRHYLVNENVKYMAIIDSERLAFSYERSNEVGIFNVQTLQTEKRIVFKENCYGLSYDSKNLYAVGTTTIQCVEMKDDPVHMSSVPVKTNTVAFLSVHGDRLYYANYNNHTVYCSEKNGEEIWSFKNEIMKFPIGITTDQYGNSYVACTLSNNVLVISADGKNYKELLNKLEGLLNPRAIFFDKRDNRLLVCNNENGQALLCTMK